MANDSSQPADIYSDTTDEIPRSSRILIIDDDAVHVQLCKRYLRSDSESDHTVVSASSIQYAVAAACVDTFDCIIVDYKLPDGSGTQAIEQLRQTLGSNMPCTIVLTGDKGGQSAIDAVRSGASDYMTKSNLTRSSLLRSVSNAIETSRLKTINTRRVKELEVANALLRKRNEEIQRFYHTVSHEVKTPLTAIQEFVSIVHDGLAGDVQDEQKRILQYALESCDQIKSQFNDLLELSRFETGKMQVKLKPECIYHVFDHCQVSAAPTALARKIELSIVDVPDLPMVMMQASRIIQVLSNLIGNALKFTPENGKVTLRAELIDGGDKLRLSVKDTGCGIPAEDVKHVFDRLYQVTPTSDMENESGMGLGLSIAAQIVELHGSRIELESTVGEGSEFSFNLDTCHGNFAIQDNAA